MSKSSFQFLDVSFLIPHGYHFTQRICKNFKSSLTKVNYEDHHLACKIIDRERRPKDERIVEMLKKIRHPSIVPIHSIFQNGFLLFIFMQWMEEGNLLQYIRKNGAVEEKRAKIWFRQLISALKFLHDLQIAHCNLSCASIMITRDQNVKISGLSYLTMCNNKNKSAKMRSSLPAYCRSPEQHSSLFYNPLKADIFSLGVILFTMLNNSIPFTSTDLAELVSDQNNRRYCIRASYLHKLSIDCQVAIHTLLEPDANVRWSVDKLFCMKWLECENFKI